MHTFPCVVHQISLY